MTGCECGDHDGERSFFCNRHKLKKYAPWLKLCQTRQAYFDVWEAGRGPGQLVPLPPQPPLEPGVIEAGERLGITARLRTYATALRKWAAAGFPTRSDEEVERIYSEHCVPCKYFQRGHCAKCGCKLRSTVTIHSKLKMATESCPESIW